MTTPAEVEAIHLAADLAEDALAAAESQLDIAAARQLLSDEVMDVLMPNLWNLRIARDAAVAASDAILRAEAKAKAEWASMKITR